MEPLRVLIVDDTPDVRSFLRISMTHEPGLEIVGEAEDGREAIAMVRETRPDVVVMDLMMPVMDGVEATRIITQEHPGVVVIGFTSAGDPGSQAAMAAAGAVVQVRKENLGELIDVLLQHASQSA
ncbi:MAG: response regulator [Actinomycetota bacterium]|nr:response regulator [Actinomycetota bacterium]